MEDVGRESHVRSLLKGVTWRFVGTGTTLLVAWGFTGSVKQAAGIAGVEFFAKFFIYYLHERVWLMVPRGVVRRWWGRWFGGGRG